MAALYSSYMSLSIWISSALFGALSSAGIPIRSLSRASAASATLLSHYEKADAADDFLAISSGLNYG